GMYKPHSPQLLTIREHIAANVKQLRANVESPALRRKVGRPEGDKLTRMPRGFPMEHEAAEYLKHRHFIAGAEFPPALAASPRFYGTLLAVFREVLPLARFLNAPMLKG